jgi:hypothetical protein
MIVEETHKVQGNQKRWYMRTIFLAPALIFMPVVGIASAISEEPPVPLAKEIGTAIEEWSALHPNQDIPATDKFINYPDYLQVLIPDENLIPTAGYRENIEGMMVKVVRSENIANDFIVCAYTQKGFTEESKKESFNSLHAYNSETNEVVANAVERCS